MLWPGIEADGSIESTTPSKLETRDEMGRLEKVNDLFHETLDLMPLTV
jgi:hypothetical protein